MDEAARTNAIQSDLDETTRCLITRGADKDLAAEEKENMRFGRAEKEILSQLEVACEPAKDCSTFIQASKVRAHHDDLANAKTMLSLMKSPSFMMLEDLLNCQSVKDLHARKRAMKVATSEHERDLLLHDADEDTASPCVVMKDCVDHGRKLFVEDMETCLDLNEAKLLTHLAFGVLMSPIIGRKKVVVGSGLMTDSQCEATHNGMTRELQSTKEETAGAPMAIDVSETARNQSSDGGGSDDCDEVSPHCAAAACEMKQLNKAKRKECRPKHAADSRALFMDKGNGPEAAIVLGEPTEPGDNLSSGKNLFHCLGSSGKLDLLDSTLITKNAGQERTQ